MMQLWVRRARALRALAPYNRSICGSPVFRSSSRSRACRDHHVGGGARAVVHRGRMQTAFEYSSQAGAAAALRGPVGLGSPQTAPRSRLSAFVLTFRFNVARSCLRHAAAAASRMRKEALSPARTSRRQGSQADAGGARSTRSPQRPTSDRWPGIPEPMVRGGVEPPTFRFSGVLSPPRP